MATTTELTLESLGLDQDKLADKLVDRLAQNMLTSIGYDEDGDEWFGTSPFANKLNNMVKPSSRSMTICAHFSTGYRANPRRS